MENLHIDDNKMLWIYAMLFFLSSYVFIYLFYKDRD